MEGEAILFKQQCLVLKGTVAQDRWHDQGPATAVIVAQDRVEPILIEPVRVAILGGVRLRPSSLIVLRIPRGGLSFGLFRIFHAGAPAATRSSAITAQA